MAEPADGPQRPRSHAFDFAVAAAGVLVAVGVASRFGWWPALATGCGSLLVAAVWLWWRGVSRDLDGFQLAGLILTAVVTAAGGLAQLAEREREEQAERAAAAERAAVADASNPDATTAALARVAAAPLATPRAREAAIRQLVGRAGPEADLALLGALAAEVTLWGPVTASTMTASDELTRELTRRGVPRDRIEDAARRGWEECLLQEFFLSKHPWARERLIDWERLTATSTE